jgi:hypothetical protein
VCTKNRINLVFEAIRALPDEADAYGISANQREMLTILETAHVYLKDQIDSVFGADTCRKVFGDIVPSLDHVALFIEALNPYFDQYAKDRHKAVKGKYNAGRKGNV